MRVCGNNFICCLNRFQHLAHRLLVAFANEVEYAGAFNSIEAKAIPSLFVRVHLPDQALFKGTTAWRSWRIAVGNSHQQNEL